MIGDSAAMIVDSMTYGFNLYAERKKNEDVEQIIQTTEIEMNCQLDDNDTDDIITTDNDSYNLERIRLSKRKKILHYELVPPVLSVSVLLVVTGFVLYGSISTLILDTNRSEDEQSTPNLIIMMSFAIFNLFLDLFNVCCFARAKHLLGYKTESDKDIYDNDDDDDESQYFIENEVQAEQNMIDEDDRVNLNMCSAYTVCKKIVLVVELKYYIHIVLTHTFIQYTK